MLTISTSPRCRFARWGWQLHHKTQSCGVGWQRSWNDTLKGRCPLSRQGPEEEEALPNVMGLLDRKDEDEEKGVVCV